MKKIDIMVICLDDKEVKSRGEGILYLHIRDAEAVAAWRDYKDSYRAPSVPGGLVADTPIAEDVTFLSIPAMKDRILNYKLTEEELRRLFLLSADSQDRVVLLDLYALTDTSLPVDLGTVEFSCLAPFRLELRDFGLDICTIF